MSKLKACLGIGAISLMLIASGAAIAGKAATADGVDDYAAWKKMAFSDSCMNADAS